MAGDLEKVLPLQARVMEISTTIYRVGKYESSYLQGLKCAVSLMGICGDRMAEPFRPLDAQEREQVRKHLLAIGVLAGGAHQGRSVGLRRL